jgi:hypothetical protein
MSLGLCEDEVVLHIDSDFSGLHVHHDRFVQPDKGAFYSHSHDMNFDSLYYHIGDNDGWLNNAQRHIADNIFTEFDFGEFVVSETGNWCDDDQKWSRVIFFENDEGDSLTGTITITFYADSIFVNNIEIQLP